MKRLKEKFSGNFYMGLPPFFWLIVFYAIPSLLVFLLAFKEVDPYGGIGQGWTLGTIKDLLAVSSYPSIIWRTLWMGVVSTFVCIALAIPISYQIARSSPRWKNVLLILTLVPFWTNFLIRIYAWKVFLHPEGFFKQLLILVGLIQPDTMLLYNQGAVLTVMIYTYIPFAVLPIYAIAEKFDFSLLDAAKDLGASSFYAFRKVFLPSISQGIGTAILVVLIPALGAYLIPSLVGGPGSELLGDKIAQKVFTDRNLPHASALSALLMLAVFLPLTAGVLFKKYRERKQEEKERKI